MWRAGEAKRARVRTPYRVRGARRSVTGVEGESDRSPRGQSGELEGTESDSVPRFLTVYAYVCGAKPNGRQRGRGATDDPDLGGYTTHHTAGTRRSRRRVEHIVASPGHPRLPAPRVAKSIVSRHLFVWHRTAGTVRCGRFGGDPGCPARGSRVVFASVDRANDAVDELVALSNRSRRDRRGPGRVCALAAPTSRALFKLFQICPNQQKPAK